MKARDEVIVTGNNSYTVSHIWQITLHVINQTVITLHSTRKWRKMGQLCSGGRRRLDYFRRLASATDARYLGCEEWEEKEVTLEPTSLAGVLVWSHLALTNICITSNATFLHCFHIRNTKHIFVNTMNQIHTEEKLSLNIRINI